MEICNSDLYTAAGEMELGKWERNARQALKCPRQDL